MSKGKIATKEELEKLYDSNTFYEYGYNPALKKFMEIMVENNNEGKIIDYRTHVQDKYTKMFFARNWDDFLQRDCKAFTFTRAFAIWVAASFGYGVYSKWCMKMLPVGQHGITKISQTQFYHLYGPIGTIGVLGFYSLTAYLYYKTTLFMGKKFYFHVLLGERNWQYEYERQNYGFGEYYFKDTPMATEESMPDLAKFEMAKKPMKKPEWFK